MSSSIHPFIHSPVIDTRVQKSESRCKLACKRIFELLTLTVMCHIFKLYHIFQEKNMISIAKNAKNSPRHWVWHSKTQDIYTFIHRAIFIHKFICDFLMVASTYKCKNSPRHWVWHHWQEFS